MKPPFIVAEMSANHLGSLKRALDIVEAAKEAGADAVKVQTWTPGTMCISDYALDHGQWAGRKLRELYEQAFLPWEWHKTIFDRARRLGLVPFSAAFDWQAVDFLETLGVDRHKVASFELTDLPLIRYMAGKGKPMILSTGMATSEEWSTAFLAACDRGHPPTLLKCTSSYPAPLEACNLSVLRAWERMGLPYFGLSDHAVTNDAAVVATALGATMIEKHLTLSRADGGPDAGFSLEPQEFADMVQAVKRAAAAMGEVKYGPSPGEDPTLRRSLWVAKDLAAGDIIVFGHNVVTARPALGLPCDTPLVGKLATRPIKAGTPLQLKDIA